MNIPASKHLAITNERIYPTHPFDPIYSFVCKKSLNYDMFVRKSYIKINHGKVPKTKKILTLNETFTIA